MPDLRLALLRGGRTAVLLLACSASLRGRAEDAPVSLPAPPALQPLPAGAIEPAGWLRDWAVAAADGITGHLDERAMTFAKGWTGADFVALGAKPHGTGWPLEQCAYWLDGLVRLGYLLHDPVLIAKARARLDPVVEGALAHDSSFIYWVPQSELNDPFNSWAHAHMGRALVAYYRASGDPRILAALVKVYRKYPLSDLRSDFIEVSGYTNLDPMLETYLLSGDAGVLANLKSVIDRPGFKQAVENWAKGHLAEGHGVTFHEIIRVPAMLYPVTGNRTFLDATAHGLEWSDRSSLLPFGLPSSEEYLAGVGASRNTETCNVAAAAWTYHWLLRLTGTGGYADRMEEIFFNAAPAPISRDFQTLCYYQSPNREANGLPLEEPQDPSAKGSYQYSPLGHSVLCCVGNLNRVLPNYITNMWMRTPDAGLASLLYGPCRVQAKVRDVAVELRCETDYPFSDSIRIVVNPQRAVTFPLHLRVPAWCAHAEVKVNGRVQSAAPVNDFVEITRDWKAGDTVSLTFPMRPRVKVGHETPFPAVSYFHQPDSRQLAARADIHSPYASVYYGPLLFALPIADVDANVAAPGAVWNYALDFNSADLARQVEVVHKPMPAHWQWQLAGPLRLRVKARKFDWHISDADPLPSEPVTGGQPQTIELVPYGCTKFRVSMFPVTQGLLDSMAHP